MRTLIIGAGGHARVVADILDCLGEPAIGFIDRETNLAGVLGTDDDIVKIIRDKNIDSFLIGIGSVRGGAGLRTHLFQHCIDLGLLPRVAVHPSAIIAKSVDLGRGTVVMAGAVLNPGVTTGENVIINTGTIIDHDGQVGDHTHIAPGCVLSGDVKVGDNCLVGTGTNARNGASLGDNATVGAGSLLLGEYAAGGTYFGSPARAD